MNKMRDHSASLVEQAVLVSQELIRVAILWHELWHEGLEEASRLFYGDHNIEAMFATLEPLHDMLEKVRARSRSVLGVARIVECSTDSLWLDPQRDPRRCARFLSRRRLVVTSPTHASRVAGTVSTARSTTSITRGTCITRRAFFLLPRPSAFSRVSLTLAELTAHGDQVFRKINKNLPTLTLLELQYVSPKLLAAKDLDLAIPGTYTTGKRTIRIASFGPTLEVFTSKQRPRKLRIQGSDGVEYNFLLKGELALDPESSVVTG